MKTFITDPQAIEDKSMQIIEEEMAEKALKFTQKELAVVKRVIHTTADFHYADLVRFSAGALDSALEAFQGGGQTIIADTNMIVSGINKTLLKIFNGVALCLVAAQETKKAALEEGVTRSMINIRRSALEYPEAIFAIGNAPTALYELLHLVETGKARPALVIGVPVGFVEARESKEELMKIDLPYITVSGRKGGSTVAVAMINALLKLADGAR